jgi:hypothetical protein
MAFKIKMTIYHLYLCNRSYYDGFQIWVICSSIVHVANIGINSKEWLGDVNRDTIMKLF